MAKVEIGKTPTEFGGLPGLYANSDAVAVKKATGYDGVESLTPAQQRMALTQTDSTNELSTPAYGNGGERIV